MHLRSVVEANQNTPLFNQPAHMTKESLKQLEKKYKHGTTTLQDDTGYRKLPEGLIKKAIQGIAPKNSFEFISLIMNFPPTLYEELLKNINLTKPDKALDDVAELIKQKWLTAEQVNALASAVIGYYKELNPNGNILHWAILTNNALYVTKALESIPQEQRLDMVKGKDKRGNTMLHNTVVRNPESLKAILELIPEQNRLDAVKIKGINGNTVLHAAEGNPEFLKTILELIPEQNRLDALKVKNKQGNTVLHYAADKPKSLKTIFEFIPVHDRLDAVKAGNEWDNTVLHDTANYPESLKTLLELIPEQDRLDAVTVKNKYGDTVLHYAAYNPESLKTILELIPEQERLDAVKVKNKHGETVLHKAAYAPESLTTILELIPALRSEQGYYTNTFFKKNQPAKSSEELTTSANQEKIATHSCQII